MFRENNINVFREINIKYLVENHPILFWSDQNKKNNRDVKIVI